MSPMFSRDLGIDLGTIFTRIAEADEVVLVEPTVVAVQLEQKKIVEIGQEALNMFGARLRGDGSLTPAA